MEGHWLLSVVKRTVHTASYRRLPCSTPVLKIEIRSHSTFIVFVTTRGPVPDTICLVNQCGQPMPGDLVVIEIVSWFVEVVKVRG